MEIAVNNIMIDLKKRLENHELDDELARIRKCLEENVDSEGKELETIEIRLDDRAAEEIDAYCKENNLSFNEATWLILEDVIRIFEKK